MMKSKTITSALVCLLALALLIVPAMAIPEDADYGVYRNGQWIFPPGTGEYRFNFGMSTDVPVVYGDLAAVYRGGTWIIKDGPARFQFGTPTDKPFYYDGKPAVFRDGLWIIKDGPARFNFGTTGDKPVAYGDYGAVFRNGQWIVRAADNSVEDRFNFGLATDLPVVWYDGRAAVYRDGTYIIRNPGAASERVSYGTVGDKPVTVVSTEPVPLEVVSVEAITNITVSYGTAFADIGLPENVTATLSDESTMDLEINWSAAEADYDGETAGTYALEGELVLPTGVTNPAEVKAAVNVIVEPEDLFEVATVEALDATTLNVTFADGTVIEEADLEDQIIQVRADLLGAEWMNATYDAGTLNTTTLLANFSLAGDDEFEDAVTYNVQADWASFDETSFVAKIAAAYVAEFIKVSTDVIAYDNATIFFGALNQYGEAIDVDEAGEISITARLNGMAIPTGQIEYTSPMDNVTVNRSLVADDILRLTVKNTVGADVKAETVLQYTVIEGDTPVVTTFTLAANRTSVPAGDDVKFTVTARDQYNNPFDVTGKIQWEIDGEIVAGNNAVLDNTTQTANPALEVAAFYIPNPAKNDVITIEVVASTLTGIALFDVAPADKFNNEEVKWFQVKPVPTGAVINKDALAYNATAFPDNATADDISIVFDYGTGANATKVYAYITTQVAGDYTFNVTHPLADDAEADVGKTITTTINPALDHIDIEEIGANELLAGGQIFKNVTFWNVHDEQLNRTADNITLTSSGLTLTAGLAKADDSVATGADNVSKLNLTGENSGEAWFQLVLADDDDFTKRVNVTVGGIAGVKTVVMDSTVDLIQQDDYNNTEAEIIFDGGQAYTIMPVTFKNQYDEQMTVQNSSVEYTGLNATHPRFEFISLKTVSGNYTNVTADGDTVTGIGVYATANATTGDTFNLGVKTDKQAPTGYNPATVTATVSPARNVTSFALSEDAVTLTINGDNQTVYITTFDQYTNPRNVTSNEAEINSIINVTSTNTDVVTNTTLAYVAPGNYSFWLEPQTSGGDEVSVLVNVTGGNTNVTENDKEILVTVAATLNQTAVPELVSGNTLQVFNGTNFTLVGDLPAGEKVNIDLSAHAAAGVDFSAVNGTDTIAASTNAENFTFALADNIITLNATQLVAHGTQVSLNFMKYNNESEFVNVTAGAAGQHDVVFSRTDATPTVTKAGTILANIVNGMATNLTNSTPYATQDFSFTLDGDLAFENFVDIIIKNGTIEYPTTDLTNNFAITGANMRVVSSSTAAEEHTIKLRADSLISSGTVVNLRAQIVNATTILADPEVEIFVDIKRLDNQEFDNTSFYITE